MNKCYDDKKKYPISKELMEPKKISSEIKILSPEKNAKLINIKLQ